jgi:hypothetical protein
MIVFNLFENGWKLIDSETEIYDSTKENLSETALNVSSEIN